MVTALIIHHSSDLDGYGSACVAIQYLESQKFYIKTKTIPINYNIYDFNRIKNIIKEIKKDGYLWVFILDFSLSENETKWIIDNCDKLFWADHHPPIIPVVKSVKKYLIDNKQTIHKTSVLNDRRKNYFFNFDLNEENPTKAAILLIHEMLYPNKKENKFIRFINNLDLWKMDSIEIVHFREFIHKLPWKNYKVLKHFIFNHSIFKTEIPKEIVEELIDVFGSVFLAKKKEQIKKAKNRFIEGRYKNYKVCIINNTNSEINNELLNSMCVEDKYDFAISYFDNLVNNLRGFSIRTMRDDIKVNEIAKKYNGGGHKKSSGFSLKLEDGIDFVNKLINGEIQ